MKRIFKITSILIIQALILSDCVWAKTFDVFTQPAKESKTTLAPRIIIDRLYRQNNVSGENSISSQAKIENLLLELEGVMPYCKDEKQDWQAFNKILEGLRAVQGNNLLVFKGSDMNQVGVRYDFQCDKKEWHLMAIVKMIKKFIRDERPGVIGQKGKFLTIAMQNIEQHVKDGVAIVIQEVIDKDTIKVSIIDNGTGLIDKKQKPISIGKAIEKGNSFGENGGEGKGLNYMIGKYSDLTVVEHPGEYAIVAPEDDYINSFALKVLDSGKNNKKFGTTVSGYFYTGGEDVNVWRKKLSAVLNRVIKRKDLIRRKMENDFAVFSGRWDPLVELDNRVLLDRKNGRIRLASDAPIVNIDFNLWNVRHARTRANILPFLNYQRLDPNLNHIDEIGKQQAQVTAEFLFASLKDEIIKGNVVIVSSDLDRAVETATVFKNIIKEKTGMVLDIKKEKMARERNYGEIFKKSAALLQQKHSNPALYRSAKKLAVKALNNASLRPEGGESFVDLIVRMQKLLYRLNSEYKNKTVILFGHGEQSSAIRTILADPTIIDKKGNVAWRKNILGNAETRFFKKQNKERQQEPKKINLNNPEIATGNISIKRTELSQEDVISKIVPEEILVEQAI